MFRNLPPVIKNLIILNVLMLLVAWVVKNQFGIDLDQWLGFHYFSSKLFRPYQLVTYMFMHGGFVHLLFNMYALFIFGVMLESVWGGKRFFMYYILCGLGAIGIQALVNYFQYMHMVNSFNQIYSTLTPAVFNDFVTNNFSMFNFSPGSQLDGLLRNLASNGVNFKKEAAEIFRMLLQYQMDIPTVGASGAVYGILLAFGMIFPNAQLMLLFPPIPIKAKWLVIIYGAIELSLGVTQSGSNIAHFAHLGGMVIGFILIKLWKNNRNSNHLY